MPCSPCDSTNPSSSLDGGISIAMHSDDIGPQHRLPRPIVRRMMLHTFYTEIVLSLLLIWMEKTPHSLGTCTGSWHPICEAAVQPDVPLAIGVRAGPDHMHGIIVFYTRPVPLVTQKARSKQPLCRQERGDPGPFVWMATPGSCWTQYGTVGVR